MWPIWWPLLTLTYIVYNRKKINCVSPIQYSLCWQNLVYECKYWNWSAITGIKTNFLQYIGLIKAIKIYLKDMNIEITHKEQFPFIPSHISTLLQHQKGSKAMYNILNKNDDTPTGQCSWNKIFNITKESGKGYTCFHFMLLNIRHFSGIKLVLITTLFSFRPSALSHVWH